MTETTPEEKILEIIKKGQRKHKIRRELKIFTKINIVLVALVILILAVFLVDIFTFNYDAPELKVRLPEENVELKPAIEDAGIDLDRTVKKEISVPKEELVKDLNVLGVITGDKNQVVIKDKKAKKTFFLYKGDTFGKFKVYEIRENGVMLEYKGEKVELKM